MNGIGSVNGAPGISGGDVRAIELAKNWQLAGHHIHVFTSIAGVTLCRRMGLKSVFHIFHVPNSHSLKNYAVRFLKSWLLPKTLRDFKGIIYSTSEHIYDVIPALRIKKKNNDSIWAAVVHFVAPFHRTGNNLLNSMFFYANQRLGFNYIKNRADVVLAVSKNTVAQLKKIEIEKNVFPVECGVNYRDIRQIALAKESAGCERKYDAIFMKRFSGTKGVFDIIKIWRNVVNKRKNAKLGMIGLGSKQTLSKIKNMIENYNIITNVDFLGPIYDFETKFSLLSESKLFVLPSYEENWAIVIGEAITSGLPVVCYDLSDIRSIWIDKIAWVPKGNIGLFSDKILQLLNDKQKRKKLSLEGIEFMKKYDWQKIADEEMKFITSSII